MGAADVVPGVSGGTMAFILGIYRQLIDAIRSFDLIWFQSFYKFDVKVILTRPHFHFLVPLCIGIFCALLFFTRIVSLPTLIYTHPEAVYGLFFGLIVGSIWVLLTHADTLKIRQFIALLAGGIAGAIVFNLVPVQTPDTSWFIFFSGALAICAMILPGISGSFILLILNKYTYVFNAIGYFKLSILIPFGLGAVTGLLLFSRFLSMLLKKYYQSTIMFITGILLASLWVIWPFQERNYEVIHGKQYLIHSVPVIPSDITNSLIISTLLALFGAILVIIINRFAKSDVRIGG
jgi:putative membrane protein